LRKNDPQLLAFSSSGSISIDFCLRVASTASLTLRKLAAGLPCRGAKCWAISGYDRQAGPPSCKRNVVPTTMKRPASAALKRLVR
jgi:hypothetical protein